MNDLAVDWALVRAWIFPLGLVVAGLLVGILFEKLAVRRLTRLTQRTAWEWDDVLVRSLRRAPTLLLTAGGAYAATQLLPLDDSVKQPLERGIMILVVLAVTLVAARATAEGIQRYAMHSGTFLPASSLVTNISKLVVFTLGILLILANLGISIGPIVGALGIGTLAVGLALQPTLANFFAGFQILATRQIRDGDYVRLESGEEGYVVDIRWRNTTIKALWEDHEVIVPNSKLSDSIVLNYSLPARPLWVRIPVGVSYRSDLERVERATMEVAEEVWREFSDAREGDEPILRYDAFAESAVTFQVRILIDEFSQQFRVRHEFIKRLHARYAAEDIVIPWPIRTLDFPETVRVETVRGRERGPSDGEPGDGGPRVGGAREAREGREGPPGG